MPIASEAEGEDTAMTEEDGGSLKGPRTEPPPPSRPVRRCLFGEVDHEANRRDLIRIREELSSAYKRRWNYDFENGCPLEGQYRWRRVQRGPSTECSRNVEAMPYHFADCSPSGEELVGCVNFDLDIAPLDSSLSSDSAPGTRCSSRVTDAADDGSESERVATRRRTKQPTLKEYFRVKKRSANKLQVSK